MKEVSPKSNQSNSILDFYKQSSLFLLAHDFIFTLSLNGFFIPLSFLKEAFLIFCG